MTYQEIVVRYTYRVEQSGEGVFATCLEADAMGEGATKKEAVEELRDALYRRLLSPDAVAPPSVRGHHRVVLVEADPPPEG